MSLFALMATLPTLLVYASVAAFVGVESIGIPVPGETALIAGVLLSIHPAATVSPLGVFAAAWVGAVVGDSVGYLIGHRHGARLFAWLGRRFPRHVSADHIGYAEHLFARYGVLAVFGGRFVALLRILSGPLAGSLHLPYRRFLLANAAGGAAWAGAITVTITLLGTLAHGWITGSGWVLLIVLTVGGLALGRQLHREFERRVAQFSLQHRTVAA